MSEICQHGQESFPTCDSKCLLMTVFACESLMFCFELYFRFRWQAHCLFVAVLVLVVGFHSRFCRVRSMFAMRGSCLWFRCGSCTWSIFPVDVSRDANCMRHHAHALLCFVAAALFVCFCFLPFALALSLHLHKSSLTHPMPCLLRFGSRCCSARVCCIFVASCLCSGCQWHSRVHCTDCLFHKMFGFFPC